MKIYKSIILLGISILTINCSSDDDRTRPINMFDTIARDELVQDTFYVTNFQIDGDNETADFAGIVMNFELNGDIIISGEITGEGDYLETEGSMGENILSLNFDGNTILEQIEGTWIVGTVSDSVVNLTSSSLNNGNMVERILVLSINQNSGMGPNFSVTTDILNGSYIITSSNNNGNDTTTNFSGIQFSFTNFGAILAQNGTTSEGGLYNYQASGVDENFNIDFDSAGSPYDALSGEWDIQNSQTTSFTITKNTESVTFTRQ